MPRADRQPDTKTEYCSCYCGGPSIVWLTVHGHFNSHILKAILRHSSPFFVYLVWQPILLCWPLYVFMGCEILGNDNQLTRRSEVTETMSHGSWPSWLQGQQVHRFKRPSNIFLFQLSAADVILLISMVTQQFYESPKNFPFQQSLCKAIYGTDCFAQEWFQISLFHSLARQSR